jgi:hypothetical protein
MMSHSDRLRILFARKLIIRTEIETTTRKKPSSLMAKA